MDEKKYIERGMLFDNLYKAWGNEIDGGVCNSFMEIVNSTPTADVRPVKRGNWVPSDMQEGWITCSVCKKLKFDGRMALSPDLFEAWGLNFCPNCGADMRQVKEEEGR